jgi:carboxyl-terminal processing protease
VLQGIKIPRIADWNFFPCRGLYLQTDNNMNMVQIRSCMILVLLFLGVVTGRAQLTSPEAFKLALVMEKVSRYYVDSINETEVVEDAIEHLLHKLDPHSSYVSKEELEDLNEQLEGEFEGIGISFNILDDTIFIIRAISGGPSESVGIMAGDRIIKVEGETVAGTGITTRDVQHLLKGPKGTMVDVSIRRRGVTDLLDFTITRDKIPVYSLDASYMVNDRIGYVKLARFSHTSVEEFEIAMDGLKKEGMKDLILDLSGNGGGWLPVAVDLADHFISGTKEIVRTEGKNVPDRRYRARKPGLFEEGNLVIMIDGNSASASEIVSGAVQDWDRGVIVGRRSFGKGLVQQPFPLGDGSMIRLTVARYYTPTGRLIQKPYEDGYEEYEMDLINRYNKGELSSADSIVFPESQRFKTLTLGRTVYGGGGIMPDYFVPLDTTSYSDYYRELISKGIFNRFILQYVDEHRDEYLEKYPDFETFRDQFQPGQEQLDALVDYAGSEDLAFDQDQWDLSSKQITHLLKAYMARDLWSIAHFYEVYNTTNEVFNRAVEILNDPAMVYQKLAKAEHE